MSSPMADLKPLDREALRKALRRFLYLYPSGAFTAEMIARALRQYSLLHWEPETADVQAELELLRDLGMVKSVADPLGASVYWQITGQGRLAYERGGAA